MTILSAAFLAAHVRDKDCNIPVKYKYSNVKFNIRSLEPSKACSNHIDVLNSPL